MKKATILTAAMLALSASLAMASGVNLYKDDCGAGAQLRTVTNTCASNSGVAFTVFGSMIMPAVTKTSFVGAMSIVDVQNGGSATEDWWKMSCRSAAFVLATDALMGGSCATLWDVVPAAGNNISPVYAAENAPATRTRFLLGAVLLSTNAYDLVGDNATEQSVFKLSVGRTLSTGGGACAGCATPVCIVLNEIQLQGLYDLSDADFVRITDPITATPGSESNTIIYNTGPSLPACPSAVPVRNRTWGSVKALYR